MEENWGSGSFNRITALSALLLIVNLCLTAVLLSLPAYPCSTPEEAFSGRAVATLLEKAGGGTLRSRLLKQNDGTVVLVTVEKHFLLERWRFLEVSPVDGNYIMLSGQTSQLLVTFHSPEDVNQYQVTFGLPKLPEHTLLWSLCLLAIELTLWAVSHKLRKG